MQAPSEMRWVLDQLTRRRIHDEKIACAKLAMQALIQRVPPGQDIDVEGTAKAAMAIAKTMVAEFANEKLI